MLELQELLDGLGLELIENAGPSDFWRNSRAENAEYQLRAATSDRDRLAARCTTLESELGRISLVLGEAPHDEGLADAIEHHVKRLAARVQELEAKPRMGLDNET